MVLLRPGLMLHGTQSTTTKLSNTQSGTVQAANSTLLTLNSCKPMNTIPRPLPPPPNPPHSTVEKIERLLTELQLLTQQLKYENTNTITNGIRRNSTDSRNSET